MDPAKIKKSRNVHLKATIHSCIQILLIITTAIPHLYLQTLEMLTASGYHINIPGTAFHTRKDFKGSHSISSNNVDMSFPDVLRSEHLLHSRNNIFNTPPHIHPKQIQPQSTQQGVNGVVDGEWQDTSILSDSSQKYSPYHHESLSSKRSNFLHATLEVVRFSNITSDTSSDNNESSGEDESEGGISVGIAATAAAAITFTFGASQLAKLIAVTVNYALLALGTPFAYIASCHRFREQFTSILFSHGPNSPQNSTYHHGHHNHSSFSHKAHRDRFHYLHRSTTGGTQDACFSSPLTRADTRTSTSIIQNHSSRLGRANTHGASFGEIGVTRESISMSGNTRSSFSHSFKSRSSLRKSSVGSSMKRRKSSGSGPCGIGIISGDGCVANSSLGCGKGLIGVSIAADSVFMGSDAALILEQDTSNGSSSNGNLNKPIPSPTGDHDDDTNSGSGSSGALVPGHSSSGSSSSSQQNFPCHHHHPIATTMTTIANSNSSSLNTYLQPYGIYGYRTDLGQPV